MELTLDEAAARFNEAVQAAARGERVLVTQDGRPVAEVVAARQGAGMDFEKAAETRRAMGLDGLTVHLPPHFDDEVFSRRVLGLDP